MATVSEQVLAGGIFDHRWIAEHLNLTIVVASGNKLQTVVQRTMGSICVVDVGAILLRLPDALYGPPENATLSCPFLVPRVSSTTGILRAIWDGVVEDLVGSVIGANHLGVHAPVDVKDRCRAPSEGLHFLPCWHRVEVEFLVMASADQVLSVWGEL